MNGQKNRRILLAPLDWGLGHATRCIPIVRSLQENGHEVVLAADGAVAALFNSEFPGIEIKALKGYGIRYSKNASLFGSMLQQMPGILKSIRYEQQWLSELLQREEFHLIISDNRPGFYSKKVPSVYITHQLLINSGKGKWLNRLLQQLHSRYMKNFRAVWVPDLEGKENLAGELAHPSTPLVQPVYLGLLSRMNPVITEVKYDVMIMLSGPEPQRTILEEKLIGQLSTYTKTVLLVRGLPEQHSSTLQVPSHITVHNHLPAIFLQEALCSSKLIICRSGYTTLMDLIRLKKKAVLIPTPGQPEQEYLAEYMQQQQLFPFIIQEKFHLTTALTVSDSFLYNQPFSEADFQQHNAIITTLVQKFTNR
ncbi:glycosyltransferase [Lacibacter sp. H375]|uniref:glycosyltransferase n=1 Tax=Lacibacter sp. H375 TaxID=3133424 RepID=UPI0030C293C8